MIGDRVGWNRTVPLTRTVLRVRVHTAESAGAFRRSCDVAREWLDGIAHRHRVAVVDEVGALSRGATPMLLMREVQRRQSISSLLAEYRHGDERNADRLWHGQLSVSPHPQHGGDAAVVDLSLRLTYRSDDPLDLYPPALFRALIERVGLVDGARLSTVPWRVGVSDLPALIAAVDRSDRRHPILLLSDPLAVDADELAEKLAGIARVVCLSDDAGWALTTRFGRQASAFGGFARLFPARGSLTEPKSSLGLNPQRLLGIASGDGTALGDSFARRLREAVLDANTYRFETRAVLRWEEVRDTEPGATAGATAAPPVQQPADDGIARITELENENDALRKELAAVRNEKDQYFSEWDESERAREALLKERAESLSLSLGEFTDDERAELRKAFAATELLAAHFQRETTLRDEVLDAEELAERLRVRLYETAPSVGRSAMGEDDLLPRPVDWRDYAALDRWREKTFGPRMIFHPRVEERLADGHLTEENAAALFTMLRALGGPFVDMCCGIPGARLLWRDATQGFVVRKAITPIGLGRIAAEQYDCVYGRRTIRGDEQNHIRQRGTDFEGRHACVYYVWSEEDRAVLITSMPRHLDTANAYT
ncbi:MAG: hypothetical protein ACP5O6_07630 [Candidatus Baltobacteraceae bacterium]